MLEVLLSMKWFKLALSVTVVTIVLSHYRINTSQADDSRFLV